MAADSTISNLPDAAALTGSERIPVDQEEGSPIAVSAITVGLGYRITSVGTTTTWPVIGVPNPAVGVAFIARAVGTGNGMVIRVRTRDTTTGAIAALGGGGGGGGATDLGYNASTRLLSSSTGTDVILPLAGEVVGGVGVAGLLPPAPAQRLAELDATDSPTFAGLAITGDASIGGTLTAEHIHGALAGPLYAHIRNESGAHIAALVPYHVSGSQGDTDRVTIIPARADTAGAMPASGITLGATANNGDGHGGTGGVIQFVNTSGLVSGQPVYVGATGGLSLTPPAVRAQVVAIVGRVHATTGTLQVQIGPALWPGAYTGEAIRTAIVGGISYLGKAPGGTATSAAGWRVTRITPSPFAVATATGAWDNYLSLVYT